MRFLGTSGVAMMPLRVVTVGPSEVENASGLVFAGKCHVVSHWQP